MAQNAGEMESNRLSVASTCRTELMKPAEKQRAQALAGVNFQPPLILVWSNVDARSHTDPGDIRDLLVQQALSPVRWSVTIRGMLAAGVDKFYEIRPGCILAGLLNRIQRKTECFNIQT